MTERCSEISLFHAVNINKLSECRLRFSQKTGKWILTFFQPCDYCGKRIWNILKYDKLKLLSLPGRNPVIILDGKKRIELTDRHDVTVEFKMKGWL